jgi:putative redox protein
MQITLQRNDSAYGMTATNAVGKTINMDASPAMGGSDNGFRPMETVLAALAGCSTIDVIEFLKKQRLTDFDLSVVVTGDRATEQIPAVFTKIHLQYTFIGTDLSIKKIERALELSITKYCSVAKMLDKTAEVTYGYTVNPSNIDS